MFNIVLVNPEIPPNTGNIIRLSANTGARLHLIEPLGFPLDDARMRRAGLDYREFARVLVHPNWPTFLSREQPDVARMFAFSTHGQRNYAEVTYLPADWLIFGSETRGLDHDLRDNFPASNLLRLPMRPDNRSINLSNAVAVAVFEAWRQNDFAGADR